MKIDELISGLSQQHAIVITSRSAIKQIFDELPVKEDSNVGKFDIEINPKARALNRAGVTIYFINQAEFNKLIQVK
jgi:glucose-6-phosphate-specific signal transduction histidine kinase